MGGGSVIWKFTQRRGNFLEGFLCLLATFSLLGIWHFLLKKQVLKGLVFPYFFLKRWKGPQSLLHKQTITELLRCASPYAKSRKNQDGWSQAQSLRVTRWEEQACLAAMDTWGKNRTGQSLPLSCMNHHFSKLSMCVCLQSHFKSCLTLCNPMDSNQPDSSVHEILQARILERVAMPSSRRSAQSRD